MQDSQSSPTKLLNWQLQMPEHKAVLVTGSAKRIGACIATTFHEKQFNVIIHANNSTRAANELVNKLNSRRANSAVSIFADLNKQEAIEALADQSINAFGNLNVLVNNASSFYPTDFNSASQEEWDELFNSNVRAAYFLNQKVAQEIRNHSGAIVNIIDIHADKPLADYSIYSMAKAALKNMTKSLAKELAPTIRVNGVSPGAILWPSIPNQDNDPAVEEIRRKILQGIPLNRLGSPQDIADMTYFLATEACYMTGQVVKVDGGRSLD